MLWYFGCGATRDHDFTGKRCEERPPAQSGVVGVAVANEASVTQGVCVAAIENKRVHKVWTPCVVRMDCAQSILQRKLSRRDSVWIRQRENQTLQTQFGRALRCAVPRQWR
jgi:hypothetical protein